MKTLESTILQLQASSTRHEHAINNLITSEDGDPATPKLWAYQDRGNADRGEDNTTLLLQNSLIHTVKLSPRYQASKTLAQLIQGKFSFLGNKNLSPRIFQSII